MQIKNEIVHKWVVMYGFVNVSKEKHILMNSLKCFVDTLDMKINSEEIYGQY